MVPMETYIRIDGHVAHRFGDAKRTVIGDIVYLDDTNEPYRVVAVDGDMNVQVVDVEKIQR